MKISYNWLQEFISIKKNPQKLADDLSLFGHEVEEINKTGDDYILDFEITPNRGDCLSVFGMAREISALYNLKINSNFKDPIINDKSNHKIDVKIKDASTTKIFSAVVIDNIVVKDSPNWLKNKLLSIGIRPVNNIVDITNYVMVELGQPMHAFDYDKITNGKFIIRNAKSGESVITLDGKNRSLNKDSIIIEDGRKIFDLAGIMGGKNSEIDKNTKTIVLEAAVFNPIMIRRTSKLLKLQTDASYRYERGVDTDLTIFAIKRAINLMLKINSKIILGEIIDIIPNKIPLNNIKIDINKINNLLGSNFSAKEINNYLLRLNFKLNNNIVTVPSYRLNDVTLWQDIAEEIARIYGYNKLGANNIDIVPPKYNSDYYHKESIKDLIVKNGFTEIYSYSFCDKKLLEKLGYKLSEMKKVLNGLTPETEFLRPSLLPSLLTAISKNPWAPSVNIFEMGKVFSSNNEFWQLGIAVTSKKGKEIEELLKILDIKAEVKKADQQVLDYLKIRRPLSYVVVDINNIKFQNKKYLDTFPRFKYHSVSEFAPTIRDLAFVVDNKVNSHKINKEILSLDDSIFIVELFDEFISDKFGINKKNIAYHIWMQNMRSPMVDKNVDNIIDKIVNHVSKKYHGKLRS